MLKTKSLFTLLLFSLPLLAQDSEVETFLIGIIGLAKEQVTSTGSPEQIDLQPYVKQWAKTTGRTEAQARTAIEQWISEAEKTNNDFFRLGLAKFYQHDFQEAALFLNKSVKEKSRRLQELTADGKELDDAGTRLLDRGVAELRLVGHAFYANYDFSNALQAYLRAVQFTSKERNPESWAATLLDVGQTYSEAATRLSKANNRDVFKNAVRSFQLALEVYTLEKYPDQWAEAQNSLGITLAFMGLANQGEESDSLLTAGVAAMRNSLKVFTREKTRRYWAKTQNNLAATLAERGLRAGGEKGKALLKEAVSAYENVLAVSTRQDAPIAWAATHESLGSVYYSLGDWVKSAESYWNALQVFPDDKVAFQTASELYQKVLFDFDRSFKLSKGWVERHPDDLMEDVKLVEKYFTTGQYAACADEMQRFQGNRDYSDLVHIYMAILEVANQIALKHAETVPAKLDALVELIRVQPEAFETKVNFSGLKHYASNTEELAQFSQWLVQYFDAVSAKGRDAIVGKLQDLAGAIPSIAKTD